MVVSLFYNNLGTSLIDYVLIDESNFNVITSFKSGVFNVFSDHSPIAFTLRSKCPDDDIVNEVSVSSEITIRWNEDNKEKIKEKIQLKVPLLEEICMNDDISTNEIDTAVSQFTEQIKKIILPYCTVSNRKSNQKPRNDDKPWFSDDCKQRYKAYKTALWNFNQWKSRDNHSVLIDKKKRYKTLENRLKKKVQVSTGEHDELS